MQRLRIHFTGADLMRVKMAASPNVMWEVTTSLIRLRSRRNAARHQGWLRYVLTSLVPPDGAFPDFLTPDHGEEVGELIDTVCSTPVRRIQAELEGVFRHRRVPPWVRLLSTGGREPLKDLAQALDQYHRELIAPFGSTLANAMLAERARAGHEILDGGVGQMLTSLMPAAHWEESVLSVDYPRDRDLHLEGRGITVIPSWFCSRTPVTLIDPALRPVLVYPISGENHVPAQPDGLVPLLGRTRAAALSALSRPCSTNELARRIAVSPASASRHATALRDAGLVVSIRKGHAMLHSVTRLGGELLRLD
jgi:DNA-binding transcriptional ArsR family regulator